MAFVLLVNRLMTNEKTILTKIGNQFNGNLFITLAFLKGYSFL